MIVRMFLLVYNTLTSCGKYLNSLLSHLLNMCGQKYTCCLFSESQRGNGVCKCVFMRHKPCLQGRQGDAWLDSVMNQCATRHIFPTLSFLFDVTVIQRNLTCQRPDTLAGTLLPFWFSVKRDQIVRLEDVKAEKFSLYI